VAVLIQWQQWTFYLEAREKFRLFTLTMEHSTESVQENLWKNSAKIEKLTSLLKKFKDTLTKVIHLKCGGEIDGMNFYITWILL
jgi:hypothetical protein